MPLPLQYARVVLFCSDNSGIFNENVLWYELVGTFGGGYDIAAAANALYTHIRTQWLATLSTNVFSNGIDVRINNAGVSSDASVYPADAGTATGDQVPNEVAAVVHWQTANPGGSGRGRSYFTLFPAAFCAGGRLTTAARTAYNALATQIKLPLVDQRISWQLRLNSRTTNQLVPIASFVTDILVGTQRRRRPIR